MLTHRLRHFKNEENIQRRDKQAKMNAQNDQMQ